MIPLPNLTQCAGCKASFTTTDCPTMEQPIVVTPCFHIFHQKCLGGWVSKAIQPCPLCKKDIYQHESGKDFTAIWNTFLSVLQKQPSIAIKTLQKSSHQNLTCTAACTEEFEEMPLVFDQDWQQLYHKECPHPLSSHTLFINDITESVRACSETNKSLAQQLTPTPPSLYQRFRRDHPHLFKVALAGIVSGCAFLINTLKYQGKSKILFTIGLPALLIVKAVEQAAAIVLKLLDQPD